MIPIGLGWKKLAALSALVALSLFVVYRFGGARLRDTRVTEPPDAAPHGVAMAAEREQPASPQTLAVLGGLANGNALGDFAIESISEPFRGAILVRIRRGPNRAAFELRLHTEGALPVASAGEIAIYYRRPERGVSPEDLAIAAKALAARLEGSAAASSPPTELTTLPSGGISL